MRKIFFAILALMLFMCQVSAQVKKEIKTIKKTAVYAADNHSLKFPEPEGYCNDFEKVLTSAEVNMLDSICRIYDKQTTNQLVIVTTRSFAKYKNIEDYSLALFNEWKLGTKEKNNGLLFVVSVENHRVRLATGLGTEKILTNEICHDIIDQKILPFFKENKYAEGIRSGVDEIIRQWK